MLLVFQIELQTSKRFYVPQILCAVSKLGPIVLPLKSHTKRVYCTVIKAFQIFMLMKLIYNARCYFVKVKDQYCVMLAVLLIGERSIHACRRC